MKKYLGMLTVFVLMLGLVPALPAQAAGKLATQEEKLIYYEDFDGITHFKYSAIVRNAGKDTTTMLESYFRLQGKGSAILFETSGHLDMYPQALQPGEIGVISIEGTLPEGKTGKSVAKHTLKLNWADEAFPVIVRYPATAEYVVEHEDDPDMLLAGILAEVGNNSDTPAFDLGYAAILRDKEGKLLTTLYGDVPDVGIPTGGKILLRSYIDHYLESAMRENNMAPSSVEIIAFTQQYDDY